jgi:hypothetical protein
MDTQKQPSWLVTTAHERRLSRHQPISISHALLSDFFIDKSLSFRRSIIVDKAGVGVNDNTVREGEKPKWITDRIINNVVKAEQIYSSSSKLPLCMHRAFCAVYYLDQSMHNIYINNELQLVTKSVRLLHLSNRK